MAKRCKYKGCKKESVQRNLYCHSHRNRVTIDKFLGQAYSHMRARVNGTSGTKTPHLYVGKAIMPRDIFLIWAKNNPEFLVLYKRWTMSNFDRKLTPSVNRINSNKGYTLDNVEWITNSLNCSLAGSVRHTNHKQVKAIHELIGVNNVQ